MYWSIRPEPRSHQPPRRVHPPAVDIGRPEHPDAYVARSVLAAAGWPQEFGGLPRFRGLPSVLASLACFDRLDDVEALEFGMPQIKRLVLAGVAMRETEGLRSGPG